MVTIDGSNVAEGGGMLKPGTMLPLGAVLAVNSSAAGVPEEFSSCTQA
jgi:hypothetical protein